VLLVIRMNLLSSIKYLLKYCQPYLLYGSECMDLNVMQIRSIEHLWQTFISHSFHFKGADVRNVCNYITDVPLDCILLNRRMRFISGLCYVNNYSLQFIFIVTAKQKLIKVIWLMELGTVAYLVRRDQTRNLSAQPFFVWYWAQFWSIL